MPKEQQGNRRSELWISLDETVKRTGVSKRNILDWVSQGLIKKEKKKGMVYLWVDDLVKQTPLSTVEPQEIQTTTEIIAPESEPLQGTAFPAMRHIGEQIQKSLDNQSNIFEQISEINKNLSQRSEQQPLDEKTIKELSLLGSVFRSIHQQNEKINQSLEQQDGILGDLHQTIHQNENLQNEIKASHGKFTKTIVIATALCFSLIIAFVFLYNHLNNEKNTISKEKDNKVEELSQANIELNSTKIKLDQKKIDLENKQAQLAIEQQKHESTIKLHQENINQLKGEHQQNVQAKNKQIAELKQEHQKRVESLEMKHAEATQLNKTLQSNLSKQSQLEKQIQDVDNNLKKDRLTNSILSGNQL